MFALGAALVILILATSGCLDSGSEVESAYEPPIADLFVTSKFAKVGDNITFDASGSADQDGKIVKWTFSFGDGESVVEESSGIDNENLVKVHAYKTPGTFTAILTVEDDKGLTDSERVEIEIVRESEPSPGAYDVDISAASPNLDAGKGRFVYFALFVKNTGGGPDTINIETSGYTSDWTISLEKDSVTLQQGEATVVIMAIKVPLDAADGSQQILVKAKSTGDSTVTDEQIITVKVKPITGATVTEGSLVQVHYAGWYENGEEFDSSKGGTPLKVYVGPSDTNPGDEYTQVILGFWKGIVGLKKDETKVVRLTPEEGYNDGKVRIFEITLVSIDG